MDKVTAYHCVRLSELPGIGPKGVHRLLAANRAARRSLDEFFDLPESIYREEYRLAEPALICLARERRSYEEHCGALADHLIAHGGTALLFGEAGYPPAWEHYLEIPPAVVFAYGPTALLESPSAAVLNSRMPSSDSIIATQAIVSAAARDGFVIASGAMKLGHRIAAASARAAGSPRIIVLDRGLFAAMGDSTERDTFGLTAGQLQLDRSRTLVLSPFRLTNHAAPANGARRDALIAALADLVILVQATPGGHMERLGLHMLARGKVVASWYGQNGALLGAGARALAEQDLANGLATLLGE